MTLPSADTSNVPAELGGGDAEAEEVARGAGDVADEVPALGATECTFRAGLLARAVGEVLTSGTTDCAWSVLRSKSAFTAVPPTCCAWASSRPCASSLTAIMLPVVAVTAPSSHAPRPVRNLELTRTGLR
jgi:hypothetical protein